MLHRKRALTFLSLLIIVGVAALWTAGGLPAAQTDAAVRPSSDALETRIQLPSTQAVDAVPGELIVRFIPSVSASARTATVAFSGGTVARDLLLPGYTLIRVPVGQEDELSQKLLALSSVISVEPNILRHATLVPNDEFYSSQWHLPEIGLEAAWDVATGAGVTVAVLDTGVAYEDCTGAVCGDDFTLAPDFAGTTFVAPFDFAQNDAHPNDEHGHGTHVASTIAEATNNSLDAAGVAFDASIMPVQVLDSNGSGSAAHVADGIVWATDNGADVISMSLGGNTATIEETAINYALTNGVVVIAAAGNGGPDSVGDPVLECPACYPGVIAVGATNSSQTRAGFSNYGTGLGGHTLDVVAPGVSILQQTFTHWCVGHPPNDFSDFSLCFASGTSMATPHVAGVAALILSLEPALTPQQVGDILRNTAVDLGAAGYDLEYGYGLINAAASLASAQGGPATPTPTPIAPPTATPTSLPTATPTPTLTPIPTATPTLLPTATPTPTLTPIPTATPTATPTPCPDNDGDTICDSVDLDDDNDGCTDLQELGANPILGGLRDPLYFWDFFDPSLDRSVAIADFFVVLQHFGTSDDNGQAAINRNSDPLLTADPGTGNYHPRFDRGPIVGPNGWDRAPPDGAIAFMDFLALLVQFRHSCG